MYSIYLTIETYQHTIKQQSHSISTGLKIAVKNWVNGQMTGKNDKAKLINERLNECVTIAKNLLRQLYVTIHNIFALIGVQLLNLTTTSNP